MVTIPMRTPDGKGSFQQSKDLFTWGTEANMTECSS